MPQQLPTLPAVRVAPLAELATSARRCRRLQQVRRLAAWTGQRRVTKAGYLLLTDAQQAVVDLRLPGDQGPGRTRARNARQFPELDQLWTLAVEAELILTAGGTAHPGPARRALEADRDEDVVEVWADLVAAVLDQVLWTEVLHGWLVPALVHLYLSPEAVPVSELVADALGEAGAAAPLALAAEPAVRDLLRRLTDLDAVTVADDAARLSPLGTFALHGWLETVGLSGPAVEDLADASADDLFHLAADHDRDPEGTDQLIADWIGARGAEAAAAELVELARRGPPGDRSTAFALLDRVGDGAAAAVRRGLDDPTTRPYAVMWLRARGFHGPDPTERVQQRILVDLLSGLLDAGPAEVREALAQVVPDSEAESASIVTGLWRCDHPQTLAVLEMVGHHHPDAALAKQFRKSAWRARSRSG